MNEFHCEYELKKKQSLVKRRPIYIEFRFHVKYHFETQKEKHFFFAHGV